MSISDHTIFASNKMEPVNKDIKQIVRYGRERNAAREDAGAEL